MATGPDSTPGSQSIDPSKGVLFPKRIDDAAQIPSSVIAQATRRLSPDHQGPVSLDPTTALSQTQLESEAQVRELGSEFNRP